MLRYLGACAVAGALLGPAFGAFARAPFHYPARRTDVSPWHGALLDALEVLEWPALFALTLTAALAAWVWLRPRSRLTPPSPPVHAGAVLAAVLAATALLVVVPSTDRSGRPLAALAALAMAGLVAWLLVRFWREAHAARGRFGRRWLAQVPLAGGHLVATSVAALSLGYTGESALAHGIALLEGIALFLGELLLASFIAALAVRGS